MSDQRTDAEGDVERGEEEEEEEEELPQTPVARPVAVASAAAVADVLAVERALSDDEMAYARRLGPTQLFLLLELGLIAYAPAVAPSKLLTALSALFLVSPLSGLAAFGLRPYDGGLVEVHVRLTFAKTFLFACGVTFASDDTLLLVLLGPSAVSTYLSFRLVVLLKRIGDDVRRMTLSPRYSRVVWACPVLKFVLRRFRACCYHTKRAKLPCRLSIYLFVCVPLAPLLVLLHCLDKGLGRSSRRDSAASTSSHNNNNVEVPVVVAPRLDDGHPDDHPLEDVVGAPLEDVVVAAEAFLDTVINVDDHAL
mmetsp:Transcript_5998/g.18842  ORF Transcript_5998/g.18842 Transcript_5998/m.18842 type:complete len:309 (-) Transcript_5998:832-1758(-)